MSAQSRKISVNLPHYLTRFIGREREIGQLKQLLITKDGPRLVTLTGVGGCGKTRLAAQVAHALASCRAGESAPSFSDGVHWVDLSGLSDPALLPQTVAASMGLREATGRSPTRALLTGLRRANSLLVLDNCEHLTSVCGALARRLLAGCPDLAILCTSRSRLNVAQESVFCLSGLETVDVGAGAAGTYLAQGQAVRLFLDRAAMMLSGYQISFSNAEAINQICRRLDGLPLAIELAASWIRVLSAQDILRHIEKSLDSLSSSVPTLNRRHRSMRAVLDHSWRLLSEDQQRVFARLSVFRGSFSRRAAEKVAAASLPSLAALTESSLLQRLPDEAASTRYQLHEVVRQHAEDRLDACDGGTAERAREQHLAFFLALAEEAAQTWDTARETAWLGRLRLEQDNLRAAVRRAIDRTSTEQALRLCGALFTFWIYATPPDEYLELLRRSLALPWNDGSSRVTAARAKTLSVAGYAAAARSDFPEAMTCFKEGLALYARLGDERGISWSLRGCGFTTLLAGEADRARPYVERSLALCRRSGDSWGEAWSIFDLGHIASAQDAIERAQSLIEDALQRFKQMGVFFGAYRAAILLGDIHRRRCRWTEAAAAYGEALELERRNRFGQFGADLLEGLAAIAALQRRPVAATRLFGAGDAWRETFGQARGFFYELAYRRTLSAAKAQIGDHDWAVGYEAGRALTSAQAMAEARRMAQEYAAAQVAPPSAGLTEREVEVLHLVAEGLKDREIAEQLMVSPRTVHAHLRSIYSKLGVDTRTAAAREAWQLQLV